MTDYLFKIGDRVKNIGPQKRANGKTGIIHKLYSLSNQPAYTVKVQTVIDDVAETKYPSWMEKYCEKL